MRSIAAINFRVVSILDSYLFVAEGFDRVESGGADGRIDTEDQADGD